MKPHFVGVVALFVGLAFAPLSKGQGSSRTLTEWQIFFHKDSRLSTLVATVGRPAAVNGNIYLFAYALADGSNSSGTLTVAVAPVAGTYIIVSMGYPDEQSMRSFPWMSKLAEINNPPSAAQEDLDSQIKLLDAQIEVRQKEVAVENARQKEAERRGAFPEFLGEDALLMALKERREELKRQRAAAR